MRKTVFAQVVHTTLNFDAPHQHNGTRYEIFSRNLFCRKFYMEYILFEKFITKTCRFFVIIEKVKNVKSPIVGFRSNLVVVDILGMGF